MTTGGVWLSGDICEERERLRLVIDKLNRAKLELLGILKALPLSEEEMDEEVKRAVEEARRELKARK